MYWKRSIDDAVDVRMKITLTRREESKDFYNRQQPPKSGLILLEDLQQWVDCVESYELWFSDEFTVAIDMQNELSPKIVSKLFTPLVHLRSFTQVCLVPEFLEHPPALYWARASAFNLYDCMFVYSERGDTAYRAGDYFSATTAYSAILRLKDMAFSKHRQDQVMRNEEDDPVLMRNIQNLVDAITVNNVSALMILGKGYDTVMCRFEWRTSHRVSSVTSSEVHGILSFFAVIDKLWCIPTRVGETVEEMNEAVESWPILSPGVEVLKEWSELSIEQRLGARFQWLQDEITSRLMAIAPKGPRIAEFCFEPGYSATIDYERYVLLALGYPGDLFPDRVLQTEGQCAFDQAEADKDVEMAKQKISRRLLLGRSQDCGFALFWLGSLSRRS